MATYYDNMIAKHYENMRESLPFIYLHVEAHTYFNTLGNLHGNSILELACGSGHYTRQFKHQGATRVLGVDISEHMIELAKQTEAKKPLDIEYICRDACELGQIGHFDLVCATYLLYHAQTKEQLLKMCQTMFANLKEGGRFVSIDENFEQPLESYSINEKYGYTKRLKEEISPLPKKLQEGTSLIVSFTLPNQEKFSLEGHYFTRATYEWAFLTAGFKEVRWHPPMIPPNIIQEYGQEFWLDFINYQPIIGIEGLK